MGSFNKLKNLLEDKGSFALVCHVEPDGDAIGSMLALGVALETRGKQIEYFCKDPIPSAFYFLTDGFEIKSDLAEAASEAVILLDNGDFRRTGFVTSLEKIKKNRIPIANIDHHPKNDLWRFATINYANASASSSSEIVYKILAGLGYQIDSRIANCLLAGIFYDTGGFKHSNTTADVFSIVAELLRSGAKIKKISGHLEDIKSLSLLKLWGIALERLKFNPNYSISFSVVTKSDIEKTEAKEEDISGLVNLLNSAPESKATLLLYETEDSKIKGSLRTESDDVDVSVLASLFDGGGHKKAAGFTIEGGIERNGKSWRIL